MGGIRPGQAKGPWVGTTGGGPPAPGDHKVMVTGADTTPDYLASKIVNGFGILPPLVMTPGGDESLQIAVDINAILNVLPDDEDEMAAVSSNDQTTGYLAAKIIGSGGITVSIAFPGGSERLQIDGSSVAGDHKVAVDAGDMLAEYLNDKIVAGLSIATADIDKGGGIKAVQVNLAFPLYSGDPAVDGTWRIRVDGSGNLTFDKRIGGAWSQRGLVVG